jgi:hypothetical protein
VGTKNRVAMPRGRNGAHEGVKCLLLDRQSARAPAGLRYIRRRTLPIGTPPAKVPMECRRSFTVPNGSTSRWQEDVTYGKRTLDVEFLRKQFAELIFSEGKCVLNPHRTVDLNVSETKLPT